MEALEMSPSVRRPAAMREEEEENEAVLILHME
jgi:hypothetical protein